MDSISLPLLVLAAVVLAAAIWFVTKADKNAEQKTNSVPQPKKTPAKPAKPAEAVTPVRAKKAPTSPRVEALKSKDAVKKEAAPKAKSLPTKTALMKMTKEKIEQTARSYDIELDKRMTKENMVSTFLKEARAAAKSLEK